MIAPRIRPALYLVAMTLLSSQGSTQVLVQRSPSKNQTSAPIFIEEGLLLESIPHTTNLRQQEGLYFLSEPREAPVTPGHLGSLDILHTWYHRGFSKHIIRIKEPSALTPLAQDSHHAHTGFSCGHLIKLTGRHLATSSTLTPPIYDPAAKLPEVESLVSSISGTNIFNDIKTIEALGSRYHALANGQKAVDSIYTMFENASSGIANANLTKKSHSGTKQKSIILNIPGKSDETLVIFGAHLDTINTSDLNEAPGADDDASGVAALINIIEAIAATGATFERTLEFQAYAAEEVGLVGSGEIANEYITAGKKVAAMIQMDMIGWSDPTDSPSIHVVTTNTTTNLNYALAKIITNYASIPFKMSELSAGTSDHRSFTLAGYPATFPFQNPDNYNLNLHTANDTSDQLNSTTLAENIAKSVLAFGAHYAGLISAKSSYAQTPPFASADEADIKLAIWPDGSNYQLAAATTLGGSYAHLCQRASTTTPCTGARLVLNSVGGVAGRYIFHTTGLSFNAGEYFRIEVFDSNDRLLGFRQIKLTES